MINNSIVYAIVCVTNGDFYVGRTIQGQRRWKRHLSQLRAGKHENVRLQYVANKYGIESLQFDVLGYVPPDDLADAETSMVDDLLNDPHCLNMVKVDKTPNTKGRQLTLENRAKKRATLTNTTVEESMEVLKRRDEKWGKGKGRGSKCTKQDLFGYHESQRIRNKVFTDVLREYNRLHKYHYSPTTTCPPFTIRHDDGRIYSGNSYAIAARELNLNHGSLKSLILCKSNGSTLKGWRVVSD